MKKSGDVVLYDATKKTETTKIANKKGSGSSCNNGKEFSQFFMINTVKTLLRLAFKDDSSLLNSF